MKVAISFVHYTITYLRYPLCQLKAVPKLMHKEMVLTNE